VFVNSFFREKVMGIKEVLEQHGLWLSDNTKGCRADLSGADLSGADLSRADLNGANLRGAYLSRANLSSAKGIISATLGQHLAVATPSLIMIGCEQHAPEYWLEHYKDIGIKNVYTENQIRSYGIFIAMSIEHFKGEE
jgi:hypothetical protein